MTRAVRVREPAVSPQPLAEEDCDPADPAPVGWVTVVALAGPVTGEAGVWSGILVHAEGE